MTEDSDNPAAPLSFDLAASFVLDSEGIYMVEDEIARALDLNFEARSDLEIGSAEDEGAYFMFRSVATPGAGIDHVRLRGLDAAPPGWPCRARAQELSISMRGTDLMACPCCSASSCSGMRPTTLPRPAH